MVNRVGEDGLAGVLELAAAGEAASEAGDFDVEGGESFAQIEGGAVAFEGGVEAQDDFADGCGAGVGGGVFDALDEAGDGEVVGTDAFERADTAHEHVVEPFIHRGLFEGEQVFGLLDDEHDGAIAGCVIADGAKGAVGEVVAVLALAHGLFDVDDGLGKAHGGAFVGFQDVEGEALGTAAANAGKFGELSDEGVDGAGVGDAGALEGVFFLGGHAGG